MTAPCPISQSNVGANFRGVVLIVDDEPDIRALLGRIVRECGFSVAEAEDGEEALAQLARLEVSLILCNVRMPHLSGPAFYSVLKEVSPEFSQRVVFCTGDVACAETLKFLQAAGRPVLVKPFEIDDVYQVLESYAGSPVRVGTKVSLQLELYVERRRRTQVWGLSQVVVL